MSELVLSLFPGIGLLDLAFEGAGFCIVRGPDVLWGGDIKRFHPPAGKFAGIIGGPTCKPFSPIANVARSRWGEDSIAENLIPEFERCIGECKPTWFLMENVRLAPLPQVEGYAVSALLLNARSFGSEQNRIRRFSFGVAGDLPISLLPFIEYASALEPQRFELAVVASHGHAAGGLKFSGRGKTHPRKQSSLDRQDAASRRPLSESIRLQGLPPDFLKDAPFTDSGKKQVIGNGVPLPMGRAIAKAVRKALEQMEAV